MAETKFSKEVHIVNLAGYFNLHDIPFYDGRDLLDSEEIGEEIAFANANLYAAAPKMYAKLSELSRALKKYGYEATHEEIEIILAAARGEANQPQP